MDWQFLGILAVVQGVAEFLPISSSGHLAVIEAIMAASDGQMPKDNLAINIFLHLGTLGSILVVYWKRIWALLSEDRQVILKLFVGSIPAGIFGVGLKKLGGDAAEHFLTNPLLAGLMLPLTGLLLLWSAKRPPGDVSYQQMSYKQSFVIGLAQAVAILPGVSRSGSTIAAGLLVGLKRESAATFSFLLALPAIGGAALLEMLDLAEKGGMPMAELWPILAATVLAFGVGVLSLKLLLRWLQGGKLQYFAFWCIPLGLCVSIWQLGIMAKYW